MIKKIIFFIAFIFALNANAQFIVGGNLAYQIPFGAKKNFVGLQVLLEKPVNEKNSYYGKISFYFPQKLTVAGKVTAYPIDNYDTTTLSLSSFTSYSSFGLEFGRRGYIINPIDYGFSLYGGSTIMISFNSIKSRIQSYSKEKYQIYDDLSYLSGKGNIFNLGFGVGGGMKYDFTFGTFFFDANLGYDFLQLATNTVAQQGYSSFGSRLNFNFGLGYRKIIFPMK